MKTLSYFICVFGLLWLPGVQAEEEWVTPKMALQRLQEGNTRFVEDKTTCPDRNLARRIATFAAQKPFAVILGCSDSRASPEIAFDQGIGDLFVILDAGNIVDAAGLDSVEYSAIHNKSSIIVVLGHENCGAVTAVVNKDTKDIETIASLIQPAINKIKVEHPKFTLQEAVVANIQNSVALIKKSPVISKLMKEDKIQVVGAYYNLQTGKIDFLTD